MTPRNDAQLSTAPLEVIPSIDIRNGRCVRLYQGDYDRETVYGDDPLAIAERWQLLGAHRLHLVDLDASRSGTATSRDLILQIARTLTIPVQVGGGIRTEGDARGYLECGIARVVIGTAAITDPSLVERLAARSTDAVIVAVDARDGIVRTDGWTESSGITVANLTQQMMTLGVRRFLYTDISRDATLTEPNFAAYRELVASTGAAVIASGGVSRVEQLARLRECGVEGAIIGRALYTGDFDLMAALAAVTRM